MIINTIQRSFAIRGVVGTMRLCAAKFLNIFLYATPYHRRARAIARDRDLEFDRKWGVDTSGTVLPEKTEVVGCNWIYGVKYQGIDSIALARILNELPIQYEQFTFVDFGSGKGRGILVAASFPFRRIIGVEYSEGLNKIARQNLLRYSNNDQRCKEIEIVCADAAKFPIPEGPLVLFFYNPFGKPVMAEVVQNVATSFQIDPRRIVVIYFAAIFSDLWKRADFMEEIRKSDWPAIYDTEAIKTKERGGAG